ncbi:hypothetical protein V8F06_012229 [Rhypophila decipiens]
MKTFFASAMAIAALLSSATAAPTEGSVVERGASLDKRLTGNVLLCSSSNFNNCNLETFTLTSDWPCLALPSRFNGHLGSIGPDHGILCRIWTDSSCSEASNTVITSFPGVSNLYSDGGEDLGHSAHFIGCIECDNC